MSLTTTDLVDRAATAAAGAADRAGVETSAATDIDHLRRVSDLFASVWGRNDEGVPVPSELMRSLVHAGGLVSVAVSRDTGRLLGAAVLGRAQPGACYSYIAAATAGAGDRGVGFALKQHQRSWALAQGLTLMTWTFDPLVSRNARFNLTKLGARVSVYEPAFYGRMSDDLNGVDVADRLVVAWTLDSPAATLAAEGAVLEPAEPGLLGGAQAGPDGRPAWVDAGEVRWCRVPRDIVALRREDPEQASRWRTVTRERLVDSFAAGYVAVAASRDGWYRLELQERQDA